MIDQKEFIMSEQSRMMNNMILKGTVAEADYDKARLRIKSGDMLTGWLPWLTPRAGGDIDWLAPEVGEQVMVLCPSGDPANGVVMGAIYQNDHPANADVETVRRTTYKDGALIEYDRENHILKAALPDDSKAELTAKDGSVRIVLDGGTVELVAEGGITIKGDITLDGDIEQTGKITSSGDHVAGIVSLKKHVHTGVTTGPSVTGPPA